MRFHLHSQRKNPLQLFLLIVSLTWECGHAALILTQVPTGMRKQNSDITVGWTGGAGRVHLRASTIPGGNGAAISHYDSLHLPSQMDAAVFTFRINPDIPSVYRNTDLRLGVNYCIATDGITASSEFIILIESNNAPVLNSPANAASLTNLTPNFTWSGDAPFYAVLVSDEPFKISDSGSVTGVSAVWQIITPYSTVRYGDPDPSGYNTVPAPPLISGKTYNWLVLNNYGNNSASTSKVAPVPFSFIYAPSAPLSAPILLEPNDKDTIPGLDQILFRWTTVAGAVSYKVELLEENLVDGSQVDISLWKASSTGGQISLNNATGLLRRYNYKWRVYAIGNNGSASLSEKWSFFYAAEVGDINITLKNQAGQKLAYAPIKLNRLGGSSSAVFQGGSTDNDGLLIVNNAPLGTYEAIIDNLDGYASKMDTILHNVKPVTTKAITVNPVLGKILGKISQSGVGIGILNAKITVTGSDGSQWNTVSNSQGIYSLGIPYGNWQLSAQADGYASTPEVSVSLNSTTPSKTVDVSLEANKFTLSGTVSNSFTHQGLFGATVYLTNSNGTRLVNTDGNGGFSFSVPAGSMSLRVTAAGFAAPEQSSIMIDGDKSINVALDPNASILSGRTKDPSGTGLPGVLIQATPKAGPIRSVVSDNQGNFEISLPAGDWILTASAKGYSSETAQKFLLDISKTVQGVAFILNANHSFVAGRTMVNGSGLAGMKIVAGNAVTLSDNSGYYLLSVNAGTHTVQASKEGYLVTRVYTVPVNPGDTVFNIDFQATGNAGVVKGGALAGGAGVVQAQIKAVNQNTRESFSQLTDATGAYILSLPSGEYQITAFKEGFALDQSLTVSLPAGGTILDANLRLLPDQGGISGNLVSGNASVSGCNVVYHNESNSAMTGQTVTDPLGQYSLSLQAGNRYLLTANCPGYQGATLTTDTLFRGTTRVLNFNLAKAGATYRGRVLDNRGVLLASVKITAEKAGEVQVSNSDFSGLYSLSLGTGTYSLSFSKTGYRTVTRSVQLVLGDNSASTADTLIPSVGKLAGRITSDGVGVLGAVVALIGVSPGAGGGSFTTDAEGRFSGEEIPAGTYSLSASAEGYSDGKLASLTMVSGQLSNVEIVIASNHGVLSGLVSASGIPQSGVSISANAFGISRSGTTGVDGKYTINKLPAGVYSVSAVQAGYSANKIWEQQALTNSGNLNSLDFSMIKNTGSLAGTVTGVAAATGIRISLLGKLGSRAYGICDGTGKYSIPSLPADDYTLSITAPGYKLSGSTQTPVLSIVSSQEFNPTLLPAVFRLTGKILNQAGQSISGLPLELSTARDLMKTNSSSDGSFNFADVPAGEEYRLACKPPTGEYDARDTTFALGLNTESPITVNLKTLSRQASVAGTVTLDDAPVEGALIRISGSNNALTAVSQPNGTFKVLGVAGASSELSVRASKAGATSMDTNMSVNVGETKTGLVFKLKTLKLNVALTVTSSEGKVLAGCKIVASVAKKLDTLTTSSNGKVNLLSVPANQAITLATLLNAAEYDNQELAVFLKEKDTALSLVVKVHTTALIAIVKDQDGLPVNGAEVILNGKLLGLTLSGKIQILNLARGTFTLAAGKASYKGGPEVTVSLSGDTSITVNLVISKVEGGVYGTVRDSGLDKNAGGLASRTLPGAVVILTSSTDTLRDTVNSLGQYFLAGAANGRKYQISLTLPGYAPFIDSIQGDLQSQSRNIVLQPLPGGILGRIEGGTAGVRLNLIHSATGQFNQATTIFGGYYAISGLHNRNDYSLQALSGTQSSISFSFQANGALTRRIDPVLDLFGSISGLVQSGVGSTTIPIAGALVSARSTVTGLATFTVSDSAGRYMIMGLNSGKYDLSVESMGYGPPKPVSIAVIKGATVVANPFLLDGISAGIAGRVVDEGGQAVTATVKLVTATDSIIQETNGGGQFNFEGQPAGTIKLSAAKIGFTAVPAPAFNYSGKGLKSQNLVLVRRHNRILGVVRDAVTNLPVKGAIVSLAAKSLLGQAVPNPLPAADTADTLGRFELALLFGMSSPAYLDIAKEGYLPRSSLPVYLDPDGSAVQDVALTADYKFTGEIDVVVKEGKDTLTGLFLTLQPFHPDDSLQFSLTGKAPNSFRNLRWPTAYTLRVKREGFTDRIKVVELTALNSILHTSLDYPTSQIRVVITDNGSRGKGVDLSLNGQKIPENADTVGLYASAAKLKPGAYEVTVKDAESHLIPFSPYFISLGEDSIRTDTLSETFFSVPIADSTIAADFSVKVLRLDSLKPIPTVRCSLYYRFTGDPTWQSLKMDSVAGGFLGKFPGQLRAGVYQYYHALFSPIGVRVKVVTPTETQYSKAAIGYSDIQSPGNFSLRDPFLLSSIALQPQRLEADTSLYTLGAKDVFQVQVKGEKGRNLNAYFDLKAGQGDPDFSISWKFSDPALAKAFGLTLDPTSETPRVCRFHGGTVPYDSLFKVICSVHMGKVSLNKSLYLRIEDLLPVSVGIKYVKENRELEEDGASLILSNHTEAGYLFSAFARTLDGRVFNIAPRWSMGADSAVGTLSQQGLFLPDSSVARGAALRIYDTLPIGLTNVGATILGAFRFQTNLTTFAQVVPASIGRVVVSNGEGTSLDFNLAGLSKAFTVSVKKPKVSGLLRSSPQQEVVGDILDIDLSESQPFKADSGAVLKMPVSEGIARRAWVYLGHWNSRRLAWEKVDSAKSVAAVNGKVYSFSKYAVIMGSLPLGAYDFTFAPNPFSSEDPWGLQLSYKVSSDVSSQVGVRVEVYNMMGDKVYESHESQLSKGDVVKPGLKKAALNSSDRRNALGPYVWDGHDSKGLACRNGRYLIKLIVKDGQGSKEYLKKVVMLK